MNIEEERKAFKAWFADYSKDWPFQNPAILQTAAEEYWEPWLAAKAHAEEMAKPTCKVWLNKRIGHYFVEYEQDFCYTKGPFKNREDGEQWAKDNGYRVVGE